jgi:hypothetical protein
MLGHRDHEVGPGAHGTACDCTARTLALVKGPKLWAVTYGLPAGMAMPTVYVFAIKAPAVAAHGTSWRTCPRPAAVAAS